MRLRRKLCDRYDGNDENQFKGNKEDMLFSIRCTRSTVSSNVIA